MSYDMLKQMYAMGWIDAAYIDEAVTLGWITAEQAAEIKGA